MTQKPRFCDASPEKGSAFKQRGPRELAEDNRLMKMRMAILVIVIITMWFAIVVHMQSLKLQPARPGNRKINEFQCSEMLSELSPEPILARRPLL